MNLTAERCRMDEIALCEVLQGEEIDALLSSIGIEAIEGMKNDCLPQPLHYSKGEVKKSGVKVLDERKKRDLEKKRAKDRERCKLFRQRRREREQQVYRENVELKRERTEFLDKISELEYDVQALRGQGVLDLSKENELLKLEIKKHRAYIERVVKAVETAPLETERVENTRVMTSATGSAVSQIVGLLYSSMNESMWKKAKTVDVDLAAGSPNVRIFPKWQYLPLGSSLEEARRVNVRTDVEVTGANVDEIANFSWWVGTRLDVLQSKFREIPHLKDYCLQLVLEKTKISENEEIQCFALTKPEGEKTIELLVVSAFKEVEIYPMAYEKSTGNCKPEKVKIMSTTCCDVNFSTEASKLGSAERIQDLSIKGSVFRKTGENSAVITNITSTSADGLLNKVYRHDRPLVDEDDNMNGFVMDLLLDQIHAFNKYAMAKRLAVKSFQTAKSFLGFSS